MNIVKGDIWDFEGKGYLIIPTNGIVKQNGEAVMGAGLAKQAAKRYPNLPRQLGTHLKIGNGIYFFPEYQVVTFPTKNHWKDKSDINLIMRSATELAKAITTFRYQQREFQFYVPQVGCGLGGLNWADVYRAIGPILTDPMIIFVVKE